MNLAEYITVYRGGIDKQCCKKLIDGFNSIPNEKHTWYNPDKGTSSLSDDLEPLVNRPEYPSYIDDMIRSKMKDYSLKHSDNFSVGYHTLLRVNKYVKGNIMNKHVDHIHSIFDGKMKGIPIVSGIIGLNNDYKGGNLVFFKGWNEKKYRLGRGDMIIFPSCFLYPHRVQSITSGIRYTAVTWGL